MRVATIFVACLSLLLPAAVAVGEGVTDPQIAAIVVVANQVDVDAAELAAEKSTNPEVKKFAQTMITDHNAVNQAAVDLVTRLGVTPEPNATSKSLQAAGDENLAKLAELEGAAFDRAYAEHEVAYHELVIGAIDGTLIPGASNAELKALLVKVRPAFDAHLEHAKHLHASLAD